MFFFTKNVLILSIKEFIYGLMMNGSTYLNGDERGSIERSLSCGVSWQRDWPIMYLSFQGVNLKFFIILNLSLIIKQVHIVKKRRIHIC